MHQWYLAKSKPQKEQYLATSLARYDVETFIPRIVSPNARDGRMELLFPSYVFCHIDPESDMWPAIRWASGLAYFLTEGDQTAVVSNSLISYIDERVAQWNQGAFRRRFEAGEKVTVRTGPFANLEGIFHGYVPARQRCQILLEIMNRSTIVEIPEWHLRNHDPSGLLGRAAMDRAS
jgi:transcriptional antiterminator RfaH